MTAMAIESRDGHVVSVTSTVTDRSVLITLLLETVRYLHFEEVEGLEMAFEKCPHCEWLEANV
jgi:hypothetical protein